MRRAALAAVVLLAGCGGSSPSKPATTPAPAAEAKASPTATPNPDELVRWPRFWATRDKAETGSESNLSTRFYAGYDSRAVVYNGQDVIRFLKPRGGRQFRRVLLPSGRLICAISPRRRIEAGVAIFGVGRLNGRESTCDQISGYSTGSGRKRWTFRVTTDGITDLAIDQRDGKVLVSEPKRISVLAAKTGRVLWQRSNRRLTGVGRYNFPDCEIAGALAANAPVVIVYPDNCVHGDRATKIFGLGYDGGRVLWTTRDPRDPEVFSPYFEQPHPLDGRFLGSMTAFQQRRGAAMAAFVDSKTGKAVRYFTPALTRYGAFGPETQSCTDNADQEGLAIGDGCVFISGDHAIYYQGSYGRKKGGVTLVGTDVATGKQLWTYRRKAKKEQYGETDFHVLGYNAAGTEFWVTIGDADVERLDAATGERVARGRLAPPLELPRFVLAGPEFVLVRGEAGISDVTSGLDYYKTDAP